MSRLVLFACNRCGDEWGRAVIADETDLCSNCKHVGSIVTVDKLFSLLADLYASLIELSNMEAEDGARSPDTPGAQSDSFQPPEEASEASVA